MTRYPNLNSGIDGSLLPYDKGESMVRNRGERLLRYEGVTFIRYVQPPIPIYGNPSFRGMVTPPRGNGFYGYFVPGIAVVLPTSYLLPALFSTVIPAHGNPTPPGCRVDSGAW